MDIDFHDEGLKNAMYYETLKMVQGILLRGIENESPYQLKPVDSGALLFIGMFPNKPMCFYSEKLNIENGSFNYVAKKIEELGLANIVQDEEDKRKKMFVLTEKGKEEVLRTRRVMNQHIENKLQVLTEEEKELFATSLSNLRMLAKKIKGQGEKNETK